MNILFFGDIVGRIGREALIQVLPELKKKFQPDFIMANVENIAHGRGVTHATLQPVFDAGVNVATTGDHIFDKDEARLLLQDPNVPLLRPANYPPGAEGQGARVFSIGEYRVLVINLLGRVFTIEGLESPFKALDEALAAYAKDKPHAVIVDFHAEATSEKVAMGWFADGRVSAVVGTHTHVPTADARVLPKGTAHISDLGMCGARDSVIGVNVSDALTRFQTAQNKSLDIPTEGPAIVNGALITIDPETHLATGIETVQKIVGDRK